MESHRTQFLFWGLKLFDLFYLIIYPTAISRRWEYHFTGLQQKERLVTQKKKKKQKDLPVKDIQGLHHSHILQNGIEPIEAGPDVCPGGHVVTRVVLEPQAKKLQ